MPPNAKPKVLYILGAPFCGSTLLSLAIGARPGFLNLGEVCFLEHDYHALGRCTCGAVLEECIHWKRIISCIYRRQQGIESELRWRFGGTALEVIDRRSPNRGTIEKLKLFLGREVGSIYTSEYLKYYQEKNAHFFSTISACVSSGEVLVDCSKNPERLELLRTTGAIDLYVIYLKRNSEAVFASAVRRLRKRRRKVLGIASGFPVVVLHAIWARSMQRRMERSFSRIAGSRRRTIQFEEFLSDPSAVVRSIEQWISNSTVAKWDIGRTLDISTQHLYVGNRWAFSRDSNFVDLVESTEVRSLNQLDRYVFKWLVKGLA